MHCMFLNSRFRALDQSGGAMLFSPRKVCQIIVSCSNLHNLVLRTKCIDWELFHAHFVDTSFDRSA